MRVLGCRQHGDTSLSVWTRTTSQVKRDVFPDFRRCYRTGCVAGVLLNQVAQATGLSLTSEPAAGSGFSLAIYSFGMGCLIALFGGFAGAVVSIVFAVAFLRWAGEADALVWTAMFAFFCLFGIPLGAGLAYWRWRARRR